MKQVGGIHDNFQARRLHFVQQATRFFRGTDDVGRLRLDTETEVVFLGDFVRHLHGLKQVLPCFR